MCALRSHFDAPPALVRHVGSSWVLRDEHRRSTRRCAIDKEAHDGFAVAEPAGAPTMLLGLTCLAQTTPRSPPCRCSEGVKNHRSQFGSFGANRRTGRSLSTRRKPSLHPRTRTFVNGPYRAAIPSAYSVTFTVPISSSACLLVTRSRHLASGLSMTRFALSAHWHPRPRERPSAHQIAHSASQIIRAVAQVTAMGDIMATAEKALEHL